MHRSILLVLFLSTSVVAEEDPFSCVDPDVANAFLGSWQQDVPSYSTSIPDGFVEVDLPENLAFVGSQIEESTVSAVFKTDLNTEDAMSVSAGSMADAGWTEKADEFARMRRGFQPFQRRMSSVFCHEDQPGSVSVIARKKTDQTLVSLVHHTEPVSRSCDEPPPEPPRHDPRELMNKLPLLKLPEGATASHTGSSGDDEEVNTSVDVSGGSGRSDLLSYFGEQIRDQGWVFETRWSGVLSSGTVWTLDTSDVGILIGKLHAYGSGTDLVRVRFSINPVSPAKNPYGGSWSSTTTHTD